MTNALLVLLLCACASYAQSLMICPANVNSFSAGPFNQSYYVCNNEGDVPILRNCPDKQWYWPSKESCHPRPGSDAYVESSLSHNDLHQFTTPILGRPVMLGSVVDATRNMIHPTDSFWKRETVQKNKIVSTSFASDVSFFAAQTTYERMAHMDIQASLKLDFLGGLVSVEGSAAYMKDSVESENTLAFVLKAHYITRSEMLPATTPKDFNEVCKLKDVTHVVSAITYGMDAYFAFKKNVQTHQSKQKIAGDLKIAIKSIPMIKIEAGVKVIINGSLKEKIKGIDAKLRGDFVLEKQPTTYVESVLVFSKLTSHLGEKPDYLQASKMKMMLTPVTRFCDQSSAILLDISQALVQRVTKMLDKIERTKLKAKTLEMTDACQNYLPLQKMMNLFSTKLDIFSLEIKSELQTILPKIRSGKAGSGEKDLIALFTKYKLSPFYDDTCQIFLKTRQREIELLDFILDPDSFKGTQVEVVSYEDAGDVKTLFKKEMVLMLQFNILPDVSVMERFLDGKEVDESHSWFNNMTVVSIMGRTFKSFMQFAAANKLSDKRGFLVATYNAKEKFVNVYAQKDNRILTDNFITPQAPSTITIISNEYDSITFHAEKPSNIWVVGFTLKYWKYGRKSDAVETTFSFKGANTYNVAGLSANEVYVFAMKYVTEMGCSPYGPESSPVVTKPCSLPSSVKAKDILSTSVALHWETPLHIGKGVDIVDYTLSLQQGDKVITIQQTKGTHSITFKGLEPAMKYKISVQAMAKIQKHNGSEEGVIPTSSKAWLSVVTSPDHPSQPILVAIAYHSAQVAWTPPTRIAVGSLVHEYLVQYMLLNNLGNKTLTGSNMVQSSKNKTSITLKDLVQGSTYGISVKVVTSLGASDYSPILIVKTRFKETELDTLRHSVEKEIAHSVSVSTSNLQKLINNEAKRLGDVKTELETSIRDVKSSVKTEFTHSIDSVKSTFQKSIGDVKSRLSYSIANVGSKLESAKSSLGNEIRRNTNGIATHGYLTFYDHGFAEHSHYVAEYFTTRTSCLQMCVNVRRNKGSSWDGVVYRASSRRCECYQNTGKFYRNNEWAHYRFV